MEQQGAVSQPMGYPLHEREGTSMTNTTKLVRFALPAAVVGVGIAAAVMLGGAREKKTATISSGTVLVGSLEQPVSTDRSSVGDHITLQTVDPIRGGDGSRARPSSRSTSPSSRSTVRLMRSRPTRSR